MVFLQPASTGTPMEPHATPISTPRDAEAEIAANRVALSGMPQGHWAGATKQHSHRHLEVTGAGATMVSPHGFHTTMGDPNASSVNQSGATYVSYDAGSKLHHGATLTSMNRSGNRSAISAGRNGTPTRQQHRSLSASRRSPQRRPNSSMGFHNQTRLLDGSVHTADAACCGFRDLDQHQTHHKKVKGLFVTFCQNSMEAQLANATRQLACESEARVVEEEYHRQKLAALVHQNDKLKAEHAEMKQKVEEWNEVHEKNTKEIIVLKEQYEKKWREELELSTKLRLMTNEAVETAEKLKTEDGARRYRITELESDVENLKTVIQRTESQSSDNAKRAQIVFDEKELIRKSNENNEERVQELEQLLRVKESVIVGLEKELSRANDKLSSVAFFKESFASGKKKKLGKGGPSSPPGSFRLGSPTGGGGGGQHETQVKDRLYQRYFGRTK